MDRCNDIPEKTCRYCGKKFPPASQHALKDGYGYYCKPTCYLHRHELKAPRSRRVIATQGDKVEIYGSAKVAADQMGVEPKAIRKACHDGTTCKGYTWKYEGG